MGKFVRRTFPNRRRGQIGTYRVIMMARYENPTLRRLMRHKKVELALLFTDAMQLLDYAVIDKQLPSDLRDHLWKRAMGEVPFRELPMIDPFGDDAS